MDPISSISAVSQSGAASSLLGTDGANTLVQKSGGSTFAFNIPQAVEVPGISPAQTMAPTQVYMPANRGTDLASLPRQMINEVNQIQSTAGEKVRDVLMGGPTTVNDAMVSVQESTVAFKLLSEMRNKVVDSYQQIMQMQI